MVAAMTLCELRQHGGRGAPGTTVEDRHRALRTGLVKGRRRVLPRSGAAAMQDRPHPSRVKVQLVGAEGERAEGAAAHGMSGNAGEADRRSGGSAHAKTAGFGTEGAGRVLHLDRAASRLGNPGPVL